MNTVTSMQEAAVYYANNLLSSLNQSVTGMVGVDAMWFRAIPDKRSQDVIFQSYTLYGVEDCPLNIRVMYSDVSYDDAAITYNIMGLAYAIPLTIEISVNDWKRVTNNDGTIPQQHDIVYIPLSKKILEVVSMQPVKSMGAQLTAYKLNMEIYKPSKSRIIGENLSESIEESTTNLEKRFGQEIDDAIKDIIDDNQLSLYNSTNKDPYKEVQPDVSEESSIEEIRSIKQEDVVIDGHTVARSYYSLSTFGKIVTKYKVSDSFSTLNGRCYTCLFRAKDTGSENVIKNIKGNVEYSFDDSFGYLTTTIGSKFKVGDNVVFKRGKMIVPGEIIKKNVIKIDKNIANNLSKTSQTWYKLPGFSISLDNTINLLHSDDFSINLKGNNYLYISYKGKEQSLLLTASIKNELWYGIVINLSDTFNVDLYFCENELYKISELRDIKNEIYRKVDMNNISLMSSFADITNIRLYDVLNNNTDKQMTDLVNYNVKNNSHCIINDSADVYLNKPFMGRQR